MNALVLARPLLLGILAVLATPALAERQELARSVAMKQAAGPDVQQALSTLDGLERLADPKALAEVAGKMAADPAMTPAGRDRLLTDAARRLGSMPDSAASRQFLEGLAIRKSEVWIPVEETGGLVHIPLYDAGAQARHTLKTLDIRAVARDLTPRAARGEAGLAVEARAAAPGSVFRQGLKQALLDARATAAGSAGPASISHSLAALLPQDPSLGTLALTARDPADRDVLAGVLDLGDTASGLAALPLTRSLPSPEARPLLEIAARRGDIASAAVLEAGRRWPEDPDTGRWLETLLGDPGVGASAASALARYGDEALVTRLADRLRGEADERTARHLVLYLRLADSAQAREAINRLREDPAVSAAVRGELR